VRGDREFSLSLRNCPPAAKSAIFDALRNHKTIRLELDLVVTELSLAPNSAEPFAPLAGHADGFVISVKHIQEATDGKSEGTDS